MNQQWSRHFICSAIILVCLLSGAISVRSQPEDKWIRVSTGEDYVIEMNASNVRLKADRILTAQFRTVLSEPEAVQATPATKYKTRLETIDFKLNERRYRFAEITLLDPDGKVLQSYMSTSLRAWRDLRPGGVTERLFDVVRALPPFGTWKTVSYRFAERAIVATKPPPELEKLIGTRVLLAFNQAQVGLEVCTAPAFEEKRSTKDELFRDFGIELQSIGIQADSADTIDVRCLTRGWQPPKSLLIKGNEGELLMLWHGVFLELRRDPNYRFPSKLNVGGPTLKTRRPD